MGNIFRLGAAWLILTVLFAAVNATLFLTGDWKMAIAGIFFSPFIAGFFVILGRLVQGFLHRPRPAHSHRHGWQDDD